MTSHVVLRRFGSEIEAELAAEILRANGVSAVVEPDRTSFTANSAYGARAMIVLVPADDAELARQLLDTKAD